MERQSFVHDESQQALLDKSIELDINPSLVEHFTGLNTIFLSEVEPDTGALKDWLAYHCTQHGLEAVVLLRRGEKKWPGRSAVNRMMKTAEATNGLKVFALLESNIPLGHPKYPSLKDRHTTPDGPGKALLDPAVPAPYSSALYEISIMDAVRRRSFDTARAAAHIGVCDLLQRSASGQTVFDAAVSSDTYLKFSGRLAYPWGYRKAKKPQFADHSCTSFDGKGAPHVWASANGLCKAILHCVPLGHQKLSPIQLVLISIIGVLSVCAILN